MAAVTEENTTLQNQLVQLNMSMAEATADNSRLLNEIQYEKEQALARHSRGVSYREQAEQNQEVIEQLRAQMRRDYEEREAAQAQKDK